MFFATEKYYSVDIPGSSFPICSFSHESLSCHWYNTSAASAAVPLWQSVSKWLDTREREGMFAARSTFTWVSFTAHFGHLF